jgi:endonuclease III
MPRESLTAKIERTSKIIDNLRRAYPDAHCELEHGNPLELLVATILSAQCTDKKVNQVTPELFRRYPTAAHYANAPAPEFEQAIHALGFFRSKTKSIQACCRQLA